MNCWSCGAPFDPPLGKLSFRATCEKCSAALHSCQGCRFYQPGLPNDCQIPGTDPIRDRAVQNYCDEFSPRLTKAPASTKNPSKFDDLFKI